MLLLGCCCVTVTRLNSTVLYMCCGAGCMQAMALSEKQSVELCDSIGKMLATELNTQSVRVKVRRIVADYVNKRDIEDDPERLMKKLEWSVKVKLK